MTYIGREEDQAEMFCWAMPLGLLSARRAGVLRGTCPRTAWVERMRWIIKRGLEID